MNCPGCGRFMALEFAGELGFDIEVAVFWWVCGNDRDCIVAWHWQKHPIPAPEYDWLYSCQDIPLEDFEEDEGLYLECEQMRVQYLNRARVGRMRRWGERSDLSSVATSSG